MSLSKNELSEFENLIKNTWLRGYSFFHSAYGSEGRYEISDISCHRNQSLAITIIPKEIPGLDF